MNVLMDFFAMRPVFTSLGLRLVWFAFVLQQAITLAAVLNNANYFTWGAWYPLLTFLLHIFCNLVLVRVLLEVAAAVLLRASPNKAVEHSS